jgi:uncharacterized protein (DUF1786 family)
MNVGASTMTEATAGGAVRILAIDVGAGTQDILLYESDRRIENCVKLVLPSQTQIVASRIRQATQRRQPVYLDGEIMGGGASSDAILAHLEAGLPLYAAPEPARTLHNDLQRVAAAGIELVRRPPDGAELIQMRDVDLDSLQRALAEFEVTLPTIVAIAVQDHGFVPGAGGREYRYEFFRDILVRGGDLLDMVYREPPGYMIRMRAVAGLVPGAILMDTGSAAVLGSFGDPVVRDAARGSGVILVNLGNQHTFGIAARGRRIYGIFEHHTDGVTDERLRELVAGLADGTLTHQRVTELGGHGAAFHPAFREEGGFGLVALTGPRRHQVRSLNWYEAAPFGDMMLTGAFGLVEGTLGLLHNEGVPLPATSLANLQELADRPA